MSENEMNWPDFEVLEDLLVGANTPFSPSYVQGMIIGILCVDTRSVQNTWEQLQAELPFLGGEKEINRSFKSLFMMSAAYLEDIEKGVVLMLPDEEAPLSQRLESLANWCEGYLASFKLAESPIENLLKIPAVKEVLEDFVQVIDVTLEEESSQENEKAYYEIVEFVRVGALLVHAHCHEKTLSNSAQTLH